MTLRSRIARRGGHLAIPIGALLALAVGFLCTLAGFDRDRALYPVMTLVIASYYVLFAVMGGSMHALLIEVVVVALFAAGAIWGFRSSLWIVVAALAAHGLLDVVHGRLVANPGVPAWWPGFCSAFDVVIAAYLAVLLEQGRVQPAAGT